MSAQEKTHNGGTMIDFVGGEPGTETGERPVLVERDHDCQECGRVHDIEACPKCGASINLGFGLAFGGFGPYKYCSSDACDWFWKQEVEY